MSLTERTERLRSALDVGGEELDPQVTGSAHELVQRVRERWALRGGRTVVALAGATGSGKSSLFNRLVGQEVAAISPRRPTTSEATAAVWGQAESGELLDWLAVHRRHQSPATGDDADLDGLVLLDLPDVDSRELEHRVEADRILQRADVFVWVTDPQKYADARLHDDYLRALRHHDSVMLVVLNQVDRVREEDGVERLTDDLRRLVREDGAGDHEVIATSARTGVGLHKLRSRIAEVVSTRNAAEERLVADVRTTAERVGEGVGERTPELSDTAHERLHQALKVASGVPVVLDAVQGDYRRRSRARAGWPLTRWLAALRPDPLRRLRLGDDSTGTGGIAPSDVRGVLGRSSLPTPTPAARANVQLATRELGQDAGAGLPPRWAEAVVEAADPGDDSLADALDQAIMGVPMSYRSPFWWSLLGGLQVLFLLTAGAGLLWLVTLVVLGWLQLPVDAPFWGPVPIPLALLVGGLLAGIVLSLIARFAARVGAARRRRRVEELLDQAIDEVSHQRVRRPVMTVLDRHERVRQQLAAAAT